ncbi:MAG: malectin domain-containing carbohydrate-binding protein [Gemmataceae bacterium]
MNTAPAAPANVTAAAGNGQIVLAWAAPAGAASFNVYRGTASGALDPTPYQTGLTSTTFTDNSVGNGVTYYYQIAAVNAAGEGTRSAEVSARPAAVGTAINAGGKATDGFLADTAVVGGRSYAVTHAIDVSQVVNPAPQAVYQSWRYGNFTYSLTGLTPGATSLVRLHFAENSFAAAGRRVFNVWVNGARVLYRFDIFAAARARYRAVVREVLAVADASGTIRISVLSLVNVAALNGLEVIPRPLVAVAAGGAGAGIYRPDAYYSGGTAASTTAVIATAQLADPAGLAVYRSERYGDFTYTVPGLTAGARYTVRLDFAEIYWNTSGKRLFDVRANGTTMLSRFDVFAAAGGKNRAVRREFTATADAQGRIVLEFVSVVNFAKVSGIVVY